MKSRDIKVIETIYNSSISHHEEHINSISNGTTDDALIDDKLCDNINGNMECSSRMNGILQEFTKLYAEKLHRLGDVSGEEDLKKKVSVLECWINDLGEQNSILVSTVEELEKEASRRVSLLQEKLDKMAVVTRESCVSLRDHQVQVTSLIKQKLSAEDESQSLQEKNINLGESNNALLQENSNLRQDLNNMLEVMSRGRLTGIWDCSDFNFNLIRPDQVTGADQLKSQGKNSSQILENSESQKIRKDSLTSNLSAEGEDISVPKLKQEIHNLKKIQRETNLILTQRDKHIAELQAQLTELHHRFSAAQAQVDNTTSTLHSLLDRGRQDSFEIFRRDDVIRQLLSPSRRVRNDNSLIDDEEAKVKLDAEYQLSNNIDILAIRLADLEEECQQLRHQNTALKNSHAHHTKLNETLSDSSNNVALIPERRLKNASTLSTDVINKQTQTDELGTSTQDLRERRTENIPSADLIRISKLENELSEKNILIRELQNHLVLSREELRLKDETLYNVEQKLDCCRRNYDEKEERMLYLTSQLTNLQLEVSRLHGNLQQLRLQFDNKSQLVLKLEYENRSLVRQLNEKSSVYEGIQKDFSHLISDIEKKKKEIAEQKLTIGKLQDALVAAKINCDRLKSQFASEDKIDECSHHRSKWGFHHRLHKGKLCSCKRSKSVHDQDENVKIFELKLVIDELSSYLKEAHLMALTVEKEGKILEKELSSCGKYYLQESQRQKEALFRIRNESISLMSRLRNIKDDLKQHGSCEDLLLTRENAKNVGPSNRITENTRGMWETSARVSSPKMKCSPQSEITYLRSKLIAMENQLKKEKSEKESLSRDANVVVSSVRQWLHFQKVANSHLEEKFQEQQIEIHHLTEENQFLVDKFCTFEEIPVKNNSTKEAPSNASAMTETLFEKQDSLTNDTGIEESSILSSLNSNSLQLGENFNTSGEMNFSPLSKYKPVAV